MTKIRRADVVAAAVCCSILVCFFLWLQHTPGGESLFALRSQEVQKIQVGTGGHGLAQEGEREWTVEDRETIQAIVEHFNGFRYTAVGPTVVRSGADNVVTFYTDQGTFQWLVYPWGCVDITSGTGEDRKCYYTCTTSTYFAPLFYAAVAPKEWQAGERLSMFGPVD